MDSIILEIFSFSTLAAQIILLIGFLVAVYFVAEGKPGKTLNCIRILKENVYLVGFISSVLAIGGSLFLSEILKLQVCSLCWIQRGLIYPQVIFFAFAHYRKAEKLWWMLIILNILTTMIAGYHYGIQISDTHSVICNINPDVSSACNETPFWGLGYITIPVMSFTFAVGMLLLLWLRKSKINVE